MDSGSLSDDEWIGFHEIRLRGVVVVTDDPELVALATVLEAVGYAARRGTKLVPTPAGRDAACELVAPRTRE